MLHSRIKFIILATYIVLRCSIVGKLELQFQATFFHSIDTCKLWSKYMKPVRKQRMYPPNLHTRVMNMLKIGTNREIKKKTLTNIPNRSNKYLLDVSSLR